MAKHEKPERIDAETFVLAEDDIEYVNGVNAKIMFFADFRTLRAWREAGMPYKKTETGRYIYPVKACQAWFRGEELENDEQ